MIASRPRLGSGFKGLQQYLLHGRNGASPDRSVWTTTRNLPGGDPEQTAAIMRSTANRSLRVEKPVYHLSVSMAPGERLERDQLEGIADRLLRDLGLDQHQVMIAEHADGAQQHIHLMVNRVHPDTAKAWTPWRDYARIERSLRGQEREHGLRIVPGRHAPVPGHDRHIGTRLGVRPFPAEARELVGESFRKAESWQELHGSLSRAGLTLQPSRSGRGLVVTDGRRYTAASKVAREASRPRLEARLGAYEGPSADLERIRKISRELEQRARLVMIRSRYRGARREVAEGLRDHKRQAPVVERASSRLDELLGRAYRDPGVARRRIEQSLQRWGGMKTAERLRERGKDYGDLRGRIGSRERGRARGLLQTEIPKAVHSYASALHRERDIVRRLGPFRRNRRQPVLAAARRAYQLLGSALRRLDTLERRLAPEKVLRAQAASIVRRIGWRAVSKVLPSPAYQALRVAVSLVKVPGRVLDHGLDR